MDNQVRPLQAQASQRFELLAPLGRGGFGSVFEARDLVSEQRVALKELGRASPDSLARFKQEFRALSGLHHPNLVGLKELFEQDGRWFIVMELIEGRDLIAHVRGKHPSENDNGRDYHEGRLRTALLGVAQGLTALHDFGVLHRDLKPSNVCVTPEGRAVLLDFGLVTSVDPARQSTHALAMGTIAYMAPEQALGQKIGPAADWYALGVCLYEALSGRLPFEGSSGLEILLRKQQSEAPPISDFARDVPPDLALLCTALLERNPDARPSGREILAALGASAQRGRSDALAPSLGQAAAPAFAGREAEIENLGRALARTHAGELKLVLVEGESGVGKSELVAEFLRSARMTFISLLALSGRCYENEHVPYKAFDGCVDELARALRRLPDEECAALLPARAALLGQMFPVLHHVPAIAKARGAVLSADPIARRLEAFSAFAELLGKLAEDRPLVLVIDDLQWADAESFRLLKALVEQREPPPVLIVATIRPRAELDSDVLDHVERARAWKCTDVQPLYGLPRGQAEALARKLLGPEAEQSWVRAIAEESRGHPLLLQELVHFARSRDIGETGALSLDTALRARVESLDRASRDLIELVALGGRPYGAQIFARALGVRSAEETARPLLMTKLLRTRKGHELNCFHDRIRTVVVDLIPRARLPHLHHRLALALSTDAKVDAAEQARHWDNAGEPERAVAAYEQATQKALDALAFSRAAELSARALCLLGDDRGERYANLLVQRAHALARSGRSADAAALYAQAADLIHGEERIRLQTSAANHLLLSAQIVPGLVAARKVLADVGISLPLGTASALLRFAWDRLRHELFDRPLRRKSRRQARDRLALELMKALNRSLAIVHTPGQLALSAQYIRLAVMVSDPEHLVHAYAIQGWLSALRGSLARAQALFDKSRALCSELARPAISASQALTEGTAQLTAWNPAGAEACLSRAHDLLQAHCPEQPRELTAVRYLLALAWYMLGHTDRVVKHSETWLAEARERQDHLGVALLVGTGCGYVRHLMRDAPELALAELEQAIANVPAEPFTFAHFGHATGVQHALLYQGGSAALRWIEAHEAEHARTFLLKTGYGRDARVLWRVLAMLRAAEHLPEGERGRCFKQVRQLARTLDCGGRSFVGNLALLALAQLEAVDGRIEPALQLVRRVKRGLDAMGAAANVSALYLEGLLEGSPAGLDKCNAALDLLRAKGWRSPLRGLTIQLPLLPLLARERRDAVDRKRLLLDRYQPLEPLASGAFGNVVAARDLQTGRRIALKELVATQSRALQRFKREFRALQDVHHTNLVRLDALFEANGSWYIAMELVEGTDLLSYVRPAGACDLERLRIAFSGVAQALSALHEIGLVHRDLSPVNVCVTPEGRAVLLDFGLIARSEESSEAPMLGTADYAAPEQLEGAPAQAAMDIYAFGACLYQALTSHLPHAGPNVSALLQAKRRKPPRPAQLPASPELELSLSMLDPDPALRPGLGEVLAALSPLSRHAAQLDCGVVPPAPDDGEFRGRESELRELDAALRQARADGLVISVVRGESGLGKSALVSEFARRAAEAHDTALVLFSRCYENEQVALKAFDGAVDQLARALLELPQAECQELLPKRAGLLAQLFPVLGQVPAIAGVGSKGLPADPAARRLAAIECFFQLLERLGARFALLFVVDDLQWADAESFRMLRAMCERAHVLRLLVVCTAREDIELDDDAAKQIHALCAWANARTVTLSGLSDEAAAGFAAQLLESEAPPAFVQQLVQESRGHPLFLRELIERVKSGTISSAAPSLDDALHARVSSLEPEAGTLLALVALAGKPYPSQLLARAMGLPELPRAAAVQLLKQGLLRKRREEELTCYHDRIRNAVLQSLSAERRQKLAGQLAQALEAESGSEAAERGWLWEVASEPERAIDAYELAGDRALEGLTFDHANQYYARALALMGERRDEQFRRITVQRGHALVRLGRSAHAARLFQQAAAVAQGELHTRLRVWAAQQLIQSAQVEEGLRAAAVLLGELGLAFSRSDRGALARIAWERARIALRGTKLRARRTALTAADRLKLDALNELSSPVRAVSSLAGSLLVVQYLRRALDAGEADHSARALAYEAMWRTVQAPMQSQPGWFDRSRELAELSGEPALLAEVELMRGYACVARGEFRAAPNHLSVAHDLLQSRCAGQPWLLTATRMYLGCAWAYSGEMQRLAQAAEAWLAEAEAKQDRYAIAALSGFGGASRRHLLRDDPAAALAELDAAMAPWPDEPFSTNHFGALLVCVDALLQQGGSAALDWLDANEEKHDRAYLLKNPTFRMALGGRRAFACLSAIPDAKHAADHPLFASAASHVERASGVRLKTVPYLVHLITSSLRALQGRDRLALEHARAAQAGLSETAFLHAARYLEGLLLGDNDGRAKCGATLAWLRSEGCVNPRHYLRQLVPGLDLLEATR